MAKTVASTAYETSHVLKSTPGTLLLLIGYNSKGSSQFIQLHDAASLPAEANVPVVTFVVGSAENFSLDMSKEGLSFKTGIVVCNSSTAQTKTIGSADCWFTAQVD